MRAFKTAHDPEHRVRSREAEGKFEISVEVCFLLVRQRILISHDHYVVPLLLT